MNPDAKQRLIRQLSIAVLCGEHSVQGIRQSLSDCLDLNNSIVEPLAREIHTTHHFSAYPTFAQRFLENSLDESPELQVLASQYPLRIVKWPLETWPNAKPKVALRWNLPEISSDLELARFLGTNLDDLIWFSGRFKSTNKSDKQCHYYYRPITKANGTPRLLEIPKSRLREIQRTIYSKILSLIPVHQCAHGFVKYRSITSFADYHVAKLVVVSLDLADFYCSIPAGRIFKIFQSLGYPKNISAYLAGCCLHQTPSRVLNTLPVHNRGQFAQPHLPQGAPTSPALANLATFNLDVRLSALARSMGFDYSRYADDLAFSSSEKTHLSKLLNYIKLIVLEEGFNINAQKTRIRLPHQRQKLCGIVVNEKINLPRKIIKILEAELYNCVRYGVETQNRQSLENYRCHLQGRVSHIANCAPQKAEKLWRLFDQILWG